MFATGLSMGLAEWIIDDTCLGTLLDLEKFWTYRQKKL